MIKDLSRPSVAHCFPATARFQRRLRLDIEYTIVGQELWKHSQRMQYSPSNNSGGGALGMLITAAINAAIARAAPNYMPLTTQANAIALQTGNNALLDGPYLKEKRQKQ